MSAAAAELKPLVKSLNSASTDEVCGVFPPCSLGFPDPLERPQEIVTILNTLKQHAKITEAVLRVRVALSRESTFSYSSSYRKAKRDWLWASCARTLRNKYRNSQRRS